MPYADFQPPVLLQARDEPADFRQYFLIGFRRRGPPDQVDRLAVRGQHDAFHLGAADIDADAQLPFPIHLRYSHFSIYMV